MNRFRASNGLLAPGWNERKDKMNSEKNLSYSELTNLISRVDPYEEEVTTSEQRYCVNKKLLHKSRVMDYLSRDRLLTSVDALLAEQVLTRERYKESLYRFVSLIDQLEKTIAEQVLTRERYKESLYRFVSLIDQVEKTIQEDEFLQGLLNASTQLLREKRRALLDFVDPDFPSRG